MADVEIAYHGAIVVIAWNGEGRRNCDAESYRQEYDNSLPFHEATIDINLTAVNVKLKF